MKILEELWYGNVTPGERSVEKGGRLWNLGRLILQNEEELAPLLSEKAKEVLEKLRDNQSALNDLNECEVFVCGFGLAPGSCWRCWTAATSGESSKNKSRPESSTPYKSAIKANLSTDRKEVRPKM